MVSIVQLKRRLGGAPVAVPATVNPGEAFFNVPGFTGNGPNSLWVDNGAAVIPLVDNTRQVELTGPQTITGVKTVSGAGRLSLAGIANLTSGDGAPGDSLIKGAGTALVWSAAAAATVVTDGVTITGNGTGGTPVALLSSVFGAGLNFAANVATVQQATQALLGGAQIATTAEIATGTDDTVIVSPAGLRTQLGADAATLSTTAKTVVAGMNELFTSIQSVSGATILVGNYNAATDTVTSSRLIGAGALPPAAPTNTGWYLIVTVAGTGTGNAPAVAFSVGDWLISDGATWSRLDLNQPATAASLVSVTPAVLGQTDVQAALTSLATAAAAPQTVFVDPATFGGDTFSGATQLTLTHVDGGTY